MNANKRLVIFYSMWSKPALRFVSKGTAQVVKTLEETREYEDLN